MASEPRRPSAELARLVGVWTGDGEVFANPWGPAGRTTGEWRFRLDGGGFNLIHDYREIRDGANVFEGHGVLTVDPETADWLWFWFDTYGFPPLAPARGGWEAGRLSLAKSTPRGQARSVFTLDGDALEYAVETRLADAADFIPVSRGRYLRRAA